MLDPISAPRHTFSAHRPLNKLEEHLDEAVLNSVDYQILRRTLSPDSEMPTARRSETPDTPPSATPSTAMAEDMRSQGQSFQQVVEQRELSVNLGSAAQPAKSDPLVLDLAGNGFTTSGLQSATRFDLDADGLTDRISAPTADDALLALDRNNNGLIDNGRELFGDQHGAANGFSELAKYDDHRDGMIDRQDAVYSKLRLLQFDAKGRQHLMTLEQAGVASIQLNAHDVRQALGAYDEIAQLGTFEFTDGRQGQAADLLLARR